MALTREDHKRISLTVAREIQKVLGAHHGEKLVAKHKARMAPPPVAEAEPEGFDDAMADMAGEAEPATEPEPDHFDRIPQMRGKRPPPFKKR